VSTDICEWQAAKANGQVHAGWPNIPGELLLKPDFAVIKRIIEEEFEGRQGSTQDFNARSQPAGSPESAPVDYVRR
jgi:hypothetical protein